MTTQVLSNESHTLAGLTVRKATEAKTTAGTFMTLYGQGGSGKTTLAADSAKLGPTLHLDAEGGVEAISHRDDVDFIDVTSWRQFDKLTEELKKGTHGYKNIIVDNLCELIDMDITAIAGPTDSPQIQQWGRMSRDIKHMIREYREMTRRHGINVFFLAWDADEKDDRGVLKKDLAFTPSLRREYPGIVNIIGHIAVLDNPRQRMLNFAPGPRTVSKFRRSADSVANKIPFQIYYGLDNLPMADIIKTIKEGVDWPDKKYPVPNNNR